MTRRAFLALWVMSAPALAEERTFSVSIDGKPAGECVLSIRPESDGSLAITCGADIRADQRPGYSFTYRGSEVWKDGRLIRLDGRGSEAGRDGGIRLRAGTDGYALKGSLKEVTVRGEVWPSTYALRPDPDAKPLLVDVLSGDVLRAKVENVGADRVTVAGKPVPATHYRVTAGGAVTDVWYDGASRLVRRTWARDGRAVVMELVRLKL
jgi:YD repeat-containing protein